jgi:glycine cleavage system aminomethyltransferase T
MWELLSGAGCALFVPALYCCCVRYTGEDGFELSIPNDHMVKLAEALVANPEVRALF